MFQFVITAKLLDICRYCAMHCLIIKMMMSTFLLLQVDDRMKFILSAAAGALGVFVTLAFIPEITALDLKEGDMRWEAIKRGE